MWCGKRRNSLIKQSFLNWWVANVTFLPHGQAVLQLGKNQIRILDAETRKVAILAKGPIPW